MAIACPHCQGLNVESQHACHACGRVMFRNLADSVTFRKALQSVALATPPMTCSMPCLSESREQDTDPAYSSQHQNTDRLPSPRIALEKQDLPVVPGFELERVIGRGGMGTVYLARQLSLDRPVALKIMSRKWVNDPTFVARFTREAYAAARLNHPNLVQVYDIGEVDGQRYFSMEYVEGRSLADVIRASGKLDPIVAVGYVLQAARGLKHAHDRGMIHRDVKPDNLLLDAHGHIKVADLGLVKTPGLAHDADSVADPSGLRSLPCDMTGARMALGTPAFMSPEQCRDAAAVDHRADIYSLGCTLYALVTGKQPFEGDTAVELMSKHAYTPLVPPEEVAARVPRELSVVIQCMMAKHPGERYSTMDEVIRVLEQWLGVHHTYERLAVSEEQIAQLEKIVESFNNSPSAVFRGKMLTAALGCCVLAALVLTFLGRLGWAFGLAGLILQATIAYFVINGGSRRTYLFCRVRHSISQMSIGDWLITAAMLGLFCILLWILQLFWIWVGFGLLGLALAFGLHFGLDRRIDAERRKDVVDCERLLRRLRVQGLNENQLRFFVARYAGPQWEEFFERLFGYESKIEARVQISYGEAAGQRERFASWREPLIGLLNRIDRVRQESQEQQTRIRVEQDRLVASGVPSRQAQRQAERMIRASNGSNSRDKLQGLVGKVTSPETSARTWSIRVVDWLIGPVVRGGLALICLGAFGIWAWQNDVLHAGAVQVHNAAPVALELEPLAIAWLPAGFTRWCDTANVGFAGILLLASLLHTGRFMALLVLVGAAVTIVAHQFGIPAVEPIRDYHVGLMLGTVIALVGLRFGQR